MITIEQGSFPAFAIFKFSILNYFSIYQFICINMVLTRSQIENLTREELIGELPEISDISYQLKALSLILLLPNMRS